MGSLWDYLTHINFWLDSCLPQSLSGWVCCWLHYVGGCGYIIVTAVSGSVARTEYREGTQREKKCQMIVDDWLNAVHVRGRRIRACYTWRIHAPVTDRALTTVVKWQMTQCTQAMSTWRHWLPSNERANKQADELPQCIVSSSSSWRSTDDWWHGCVISDARMTEQLSSVNFTHSVDTSSPAAENSRRRLQLLHLHIPYKFFPVILIFAIAIAFLLSSYFITCSCYFYP